MDENKLRGLSDKAFEALTRNAEIDGDLLLNLEAEFDDKMDPKLLENLMARPSEIKTDNLGKEFYVVNQSYGEKIILDPLLIEKTREFQEENIVKVLPDCNFDISCGGIQRKQREAMAAYKSIVVSVFLNEKYHNLIKETIQNYDFKNYKTNDPNVLDFTNILKRIQEDAGVMTKLIISCTSIKLMYFKEKNEAIYLEIISEKDATTLDSIIREVSVLEYRCNKVVESLTERVDRLFEIKKKDKEIESLLKSYV